MKLGQVFYHVAHPQVPAVYLKDAPAPHEGRVIMAFRDRVLFETGNPFLKTPHHIWDCDPNLLFDTPGEAVDAHDPDWKKKPPEEWGKPRAIPPGFYEILGED